MQLCWNAGAECDFAGAAPVRSAIRQAGVRLVVTSKRFLARVPLELPEGVEAVYLEDVLGAVTKWQRVRTFLTVLLLPGWVLERPWPRSTT